MITFYAVVYAVVFQLHLLLHCVVLDLSTSYPARARENKRFVVRRYPDSLASL